MIKYRFLAKLKPNIFLLTIDSLRADKIFGKNKSDMLRKISCKMSKLTISPSKICEFDVKIAKDGILRSSNEILAQKGVDMNKIRKIFGFIHLKF